MSTKGLPSEFMLYAQHLLVVSGLHTHVHIVIFIIEEGGGQHGGDMGSPGVGFGGSQRIPSKTTRTITACMIRQYKHESFM